jgi:putative peptidoglycan lipid II flippase
MSAQQEHSLLRSTAVVGSFTGLSRLLGFVREIFMAYFFGTSLAKSAFDVAFRIPNLFRNIFGEGALSAAFIPIYTETLARDGREKADHLAGQIMTLIGVVLLCVVGLGMLAAAGAARVFPMDEKWNSVIPLLIIMFPYTLFICLVALCMGILNSHRRFWVAAASPSLLNILWILALLYICPWFGDTPGERAMGLAWTILAAGAVQLIFQIPFLLEIGFRPALSFAWAGESVKRFLRLLSPAVLGMGIQQINVFISTCLALSVGAWAPAALSYAERLIYLPLGMIATALGSVLLPTFSHQAARSEADRMVETFEASFKNLSLVVMPVAAFLFVLATPFAGWVFQWKNGLFDEESTILTARAIMAYAPGLLVFSLYKIITPVFYASKDMSTPVTAAVTAVLCNLVLNIAAIYYMPAGYEHAGMAGANVIASLLNCSILLVVMKGRLPGLKMGKIFLAVALMLVAAVIAGAVVWFLFPVCERWAVGLIAVGKISRLISLVVVSGAGILVYGSLVAVLCPAESQGVIKRCFRR